MSCEAMRTAMIDARYSKEPLAANVGEHLQTCAACRSFSEQNTLLDQLLGSDEPVVPRPGFDTRMFARLAEERAAQSVRHEGLFGISWLRWWMPVGAGAAIAAVGGVLLMPRPPISIPTQEIAHVTPVETAPLADDELAIAVDLEVLEQLDALQDEDHAPTLEALSAIAELDPAVLDELMNEVQP